MEEFHRRVLNTRADASMLTRFFDQTHLDDRSISRLYDFFLRRAQREHVISLGQGVSREGVLRAFQTFNAR